MEASTEVFYRLGNKIDHRVKKYDSVPPKDFNKWAVICEHIIAHYNEGWADGFHWNIRYWEIWNEPENGRECWDGPYEDFLVLYEIAAKHLKKRFPDLKIGGPAFATGGTDRLKDDFLKYMKERNVPIDFFSWHTYRSETDEYKRRMIEVREALDAAGYYETESILNEWAYIINWKESLKESKKAIISIKGAAFVSAVMATGQRYPVDMLMYYDARINSTLNCLFDFYTSEPLKGYYSFLLFSELYKLGTGVDSASEDDNIYVVAAKNESESGIMVTYFTNDISAAEKTVCLNVREIEDTEYGLLLLDDDHDAEEVSSVTLKSGKAEFKMMPNTIVYLKSKN